MVHLIILYGRGTHENHRHLHSAAKVKDRGDYIVFENERRSLLPPFSWGSRYVRLSVRISNKYIILHVEEKKNFWRYRIQQISIIFMNVFGDIIFHISYYFNRMTFTIFLIYLDLCLFPCQFLHFTFICLYLFICLFIFLFIDSLIYLHTYVRTYLFICYVFIILFYFF